MKKFLLVCFVVLTTGCATPVSKISESDFVWAEGQFDINYQHVYRNFKRGLDMCARGLAVEGDLFTDIKEGNLNLYFKTMLGSSNGFVFGVIRISDSGGQANVRVGVQHVYAKPLFGPPAKVESFLSYAKPIQSCDDVPTNWMK